MILEKLLKRKAYVSDCNDIENDRHVIECEISSKGMIGLRSEIINATNNSAIIESSFNRYDTLDEEIVRHTKGSLCATSEGPVTQYALRDLEKLGTMFVSPGQNVYVGQLVGECNDEHDFDINVTKEHKTTNVRSTNKQEKVY